MNFVAVANAYLAQQPLVDLAYLFGSQATGQARPDSDVDIAVLLSGTDRWTHVEERLRLSDELATRLHKAVDVVVLNHASPLLKQHVLMQKKVVFVRDAAQQVEFEVHTGKIYADLKYSYDFFWEHLRHKITHREQYPQRRNPRTLEQARNLLERLT